MDDRHLRSLFLDMTTMMMVVMVLSFVTSVMTFMEITSVVFLTAMTVMSKLVVLVHYAGAFFNVSSTMCVLVDTFWILSVVLSLPLLLNHLFANETKNNYSNWDKYNRQDNCCSFGLGVIALEHTAFSICIKLVGYPTETSCRHQGIILFIPSQVMSCNSNSRNI